MTFFHPRIRYASAEEDRSDSFIKYFAHRVMTNNKNFLCAVTGQTGSGKSWLTGAIGEKYRKLTGMPYDPMIHTIFSLKELLELINNEEFDKKLDFCTFLHFDEPQVSANSRDWQSESNKILNTLTSTFRNKRLVVFFATPYLEFIDKQSRILFHAEIKVSGFDKTTGYTLCKPRLLEWVPKYEDFYRKRLIIEYPEPNKTAFSWYFLQDWEVCAPSKEWINIYEPKKKDFTDKLNRELANMLLKKADSDEDGRKRITPDDIAMIKKLYHEYGEDIEVIMRAMPKLTMTALIQVLKVVKRVEKTTKI